MKKNLDFSKIIWLGKLRKLKNKKIFSKLCKLRRWKKRNKLNIVFLFLNSKIFNLKLKFGLYYYYSWLRVGCRNIRWKKFFVISFLVDFIYFSYVQLKENNWILAINKESCIPYKTSLFTLSKGPMVRKKQSREQYKFKQIFFNITNLVLFFPFKYSFLQNFYNNLNFCIIRFVRIWYFYIFLSKFYILNLKKKQVCNYNFFEPNDFKKILNFNIFNFLSIVTLLKKLKFKIETNFFFLKKFSVFLIFSDFIFFKISKKKPKKKTSPIDKFFYIKDLSFFKKIKNVKVKRSLRFFRKFYFKFKLRFFRRKWRLFKNWFFRYKVIRNYTYFMGKYNKNIRERSLRRLLFLRFFDLKNYKKKYLKVKK